MKSFKQFLNEADHVKSGDLVEIVSGINKGRTGYVVKFFDEDERCLVQLGGEGDDFETQVSNVKVLPRSTGGAKKKVCEITGTELSLVKYAQSKQPTIDKLLRAVKKSTMSQREVDAIIDACDGMPPDKVLKRFDVEQLAAISDTDLGELLGMLGMD